MRDLADTAERQLTFDESFTPQLSADGRQVLFAGPGPVPPPKLFLMNDLAGARAALVATAALPTFPSDWSADGRSALIVRIDPRNRHDVWHQELPKGPERRLAFNTEFFESQAKVSPDNRWIAFVTDRSGRDEVWVASFPSGDGARQVSQDGGSLPQWTSGGKELVYLGTRERLVAVPFDNGEIGKPQRLFEIANRLHIDRILTPTGNGYVPTADGRRFLVAERAHEAKVPPITIVVNWRASVVR